MRLHFFCLTWDLTVSYITSFDGSATVVFYLVFLGLDERSLPRIR